MENSSAQVFSQRGTMFKAMSRASAGNPHIFKLRMAVNQEITIPCIFILAYARFKHRRMLQLRYVFSQVCAQIIDGRLRHHSHTGIRIEALSVTVKSNFESAAFDIRQRIRQTGMCAMQPYRHFWRTEIGAARRSAKKKYFLPGDKYPLAQ